jgi:hypothetical protein
MCYFSRAATTIWLWIYWSAAMLFRVIALALVLCVLVPWLALDYLPKRRSKPLTSQIQNRHRRPHLRRDGSSVFWEMPNGEIIPLEGIEASLALQEAAEVVGGALTYELTKIPHKN